jgi:hypothetical protein
MHCLLPLIAVLLAAGSSISRAQNADAFVLVSVAGNEQTTGLNQVFPQRLAVRLASSAGAPLPNAHVYFESSYCLSLLGSPCEFPGAPGHFESGSSSATVTTDATGLAISPAYYAGGSLSTDPRVNDPGAIGVAAYVVADEAPYFFSASITLTHYVVFFLSEAPLAEPPVSVPSLSNPSLVALCLLLVIGALWRTVANYSFERTAANRHRVD